MATPTASAMIMSPGILKKSRTTWNLSSGALEVSGALGASCAESVRQREKQQASRRGFILFPFVRDRPDVVIPRAGFAEESAVSLGAQDSRSLTPVRQKRATGFGMTSKQLRVQRQFLHAPVGNFAGVDFVVGAA